MRRNIFPSFEFLLSARPRLASPLLTHHTQGCRWIADAGSPRYCRGPRVRASASAACSRSPEAPEAGEDGETGEAGDWGPDDGQEAGGPAVDSPGAAETRT